MSVSTKLERFKTNPFLDGPTQFLSKTVAQKLKEVSQFKAIFGEFIDSYMRTDYPTTALPALRIYDTGYTKEYESWFINGDLLMDIIWPASLRRVENQQLQDTLASALLQQFRRITFFNEIEEGTDDPNLMGDGYKLLGMPGLNELGKRFSVDKSMGFQLTEDEIVPLTQIRVNFRVDLRTWDQYLEDNLRTKDDPFEQTLGDLERIVSEIQAFRESQETAELTIGTDQSTVEE